jgi:hypothetical protein
MDGCFYRRPLKLEEAKLKVRLQGRTCPKGQPSPILAVYIVMELILVPLGIWVFRLPE